MFCMLGDQYRLSTAYMQTSKEPRTLSYDTPQINLVDSDKIPFI